MTRRGLLAAAFQGAVSARPVLETGVAAATKDKPQSKLWYARGHWYGWLPERGGSAVWRRESAGRWVRQGGLDLAGLPGQADVLKVDEDRVAAVLVEPGRWSVVRLRWRGDGYRVDGEPSTFAVDPALETATLARDARGRLWVAYNSGSRMWVRVGVSEPVEVTDRPAGADDICAITVMPGGIGVIWSDQANDRVCFRTRRDGAAVEEWGSIEVVQSGGRNADDHLNIAAAGDGQLWVATKNSVDEQGAPQQVLRVRSAAGAWRNLPYAVLEKHRSPTRPIVQLSADGRRVCLLHTEAREGRSVIVMRWFGVDRLDVSGADWPVRIDAGSGVAVNNVTGCKGRLPVGVGGVVLASDNQGRVYEGRL
ncbi:MAG: hypothetical protein JNK87_34855 [Bryobacterales bacterium]|nr:hypothetical protein [Bryobacterales bacterium]